MFDKRKRSFNEAVKRYGKSGFNEDHSLRDNGVYKWKKVKYAYQNKRYVAARNQGRKFLEECLVIMQKKDSKYFSKALPFT